jgi:hypothetical protein
MHTVSDLQMLSVHDDPFKPGPEARIQPNGNWYCQVNGFYLASTRLIEGALAAEYDSIHNDRLIYPILYCYRHYLELQLKDLIRRAQLALRLESKEYRGHGLLKLWRRLDHLLRSIPRVYRGRFDALVSCIRRFEHVDQRSTRFRYVYPAEALPRSIDLRNLKEVMERLHDEFKGIEAAINQVACP